MTIPNEVERFRAFLLDAIHPLISGLGIVRGDLQAIGEWRDGRLYVTVHDAGLREDLHHGSLAVGEHFAPRIVQSIQSALDQLGREPREVEVD